MSGGFEERFRAMAAQAASAPGNPFFRLGAMVAAAVLLLDQVSKYVILYVVELPARGQIDILPFFNLSMVWNRGVSFGLFAGAGATAALAAFSLLVSLFLLYWLASIRRPLLATGVGGVVGGAIGNFIDRVAYGAVVDFLDFSGLYFPWVFNIADSGISVGAALILLDSFLAPDKAQPNRL